MKRNEQRVPTRLGGGKHGYLALLLSDVKYDAITGTIPFNRPTDPGIFTPTQITSSAAAAGTTTRAAAAVVTAPTTRDSTPSKLAQQKALYE